MEFVVDPSLLDPGCDADLIEHCRRLAVKQIVEARGVYCPAPITRTAQAMRMSTETKRWLVRATDPGTEPDFPRWAKPWGHTVVDMCWVDRAEQVAELWIVVDRSTTF